MNKEDHLGRETAAFLKPRGSIGHGEATLLLRLSDVLAERDAAREELAKLKANPIYVVTQPESAPVVGGVTEAMLDEIQHLVEQYPYCPGVDEKASAWLTSARAAIRAQKRVDVEAIREVAKLRDVPSGATMRILRAIGDEPAEAPVAEPAAPAQEQGGPFRSTSDHHIGNKARERGLYVYDADYRDEVLALLNLGVKAENLRARVAELEKDRDFWKTSHKNDAGAMATKYQAEKARADAAEKRVAEVMAANRCWYEQYEELKRLSSELLNAEKARADAAERDRDAAWGQARYTNEALNTETEKRKDAEAKLAALWENPIPRETVEKWRRNQAANAQYQACDVLRAILAGREPGAAS